MRRTFPCLRAYCQTYNLEFQVVDMRWGVRDENITYHQTSDICVQEIWNCQRLSLGPSFIVSQENISSLVGQTFARKTGTYRDISIPMFVSVDRYERNLVTSQTTATACALYFIRHTRLFCGYKAASIDVIDRLARGMSFLTFSVSISKV